MIGRVLRGARWVSLLACLMVSCKSGRAPRPVDARHATDAAPAGSVGAAPGLSDTGATGASSVIAPARAAPDDASFCAEIRRRTETALQDARRAASLVAGPPGGSLDERRKQHRLLVDSRRQILADPNNPPEALVLYRAVLWAALHNPPAADAHVDLPDELHLVGTCFATAKGAWTIELEELAFAPPSDPSPGWNGRWVVVHYAGGKRTTFMPTTSTTGGGPTANCCSGYGFRTATEPFFFDFDGDGEPEMYLEGREEGDEGHLFEWHHLLTSQAGAIVEFGPAKGIPFNGLADVDGDGRPDLRTSLGYRWSRTGCGSGFERAQAGPSFVAHSINDGTFSADDAVAQQAARKWCSSPPAKVGSPLDALCTRMWTPTPMIAQRRSEIDRACKRTPCTPTYSDLEDDCAARLAWFDRRPPFVFAR
jgi:hypothetical protein